MKNLPNFEQSSGDCTLVCRACGKVFTYPKNFDKHRRICVVGSKQQVQTDPQCFISLSHHSESNPVDKTKESLLTGNTNDSTAETSSEIKECKTASPPNSADHSDDSQTSPCTIKCTMCEKNFSKLVLMKRHYSRSHKIRGSYPCPLCKRTFVRLCELVRHQQNKKQYQCATCKKCYTKPGLLHEHEKVHISCVAPHICETCGRSFKTLNCLNLHQSKHRDQQPNVCSYCGKQFSKRNCLKERPFKCEDCGMCYKRGSHLVAHRRDKHIRLRPFVCDVCNKAFRLNSTLKKHMMIHTGERPFSCPRCGQTFTRKTRLREHREKTCL
uniref:C2H2-type domain-containing protein n=1 Tax=Monopterus albus TaxID=43700 RepID=A0A3Q3K7M0_MONAL